MTVTWLIGNGFDLNLGLRTRYTDFYDTYVSDANSCEGDLRTFKDTICKNHDSWGDFELACGQNINMFKGDDGSRFLACVEDFANRFATYLESEVARIRIARKRDRISKAFVSAITEPWLYLDVESEKQKMQELFKQAEKEQNVVNFVVLLRTTNLAMPDLCFCRDASSSKALRAASTRRLHFPRLATKSLRHSLQDLSCGAIFNYTNTLEKCLDYVELPQNWTVGDVLHIHGTTKSKGQLIMGVDQVNQLMKPDLSSNIAKFLIKRQYNIALKNKRNERFKRLVRDNGGSGNQNGICVCLYGLSLGATDQLIIQRFLQHILLSKITIVTIFATTSWFSTIRRIYHQRPWQEDK